MLDPVLLLQKLVKCKSITPESEGSIELVEQILQELGFAVEIIEFHDQNSYSVKNIYAKIGNGNKVLGFCGHLDVVPTGEVNNWSSDPFLGEIVNGYLIARGAEDMKGGIACFIAALSKFLPKLNKEDAAIVMLLTLDEEQLAVNGIKKLIHYVVNNRAQKIDACILGEPTNIKEVGDCIKVGRRGSLNFTVTVKGKQGHVAYQHLAKNPSIIAAKVLNNLINLKLSLANENFEASNLEISGVNTSTSTFNIIPESVQIKGNVRYNNEYKLADIQNLIKSTIAEYSEAAIEFRSDASEPFMVNRASKLCNSLEEAIIEVTGKIPNKDTKGGTSDARFLKNYTDVVEFGLIEQTLHQIDEKVAVTDISILSNIYEVFLNKYFNQK